MLAYVFWHTRSETAPQEDYERNLLAFYDALGKAACPGVRGSATFRISSLPWVNAQPGYEDWTIVDGAWVLEDLNSRAVAGAMAAMHAPIAQQMNGGFGGLYYHLWGELEPYRADRAQWLSRPRGIQFRPVLESIAQSAQEPVSVWRRFMVLGPGTEFVILGPAPLALQLPEGWQTSAVSRTFLPSDSRSLERAPF
jgi:hypothetical protein